MSEFVRPVGITNLYRKHIYEFNKKTIVGYESYNPVYNSTHNQPTSNLVPLDEYIVVWKESGSLFRKLNKIYAKIIHFRNYKKD
ncbi:hypothetical protein DDV96_04955 [Marixanthomonas spongiae]|uniref:Uncharacterized protein n=1 Tax=Marixanthomonas spongiae TaxID=2174845 RepID=A0A2U0I3C7_9FLAO|nr:hypothetical protein DDV96_04955 [Marixanthomonas spongiae]